MSHYQLVLILLIIPIGLFIKWITDVTKDFTNEIEVELNKHGLKFISAKYPGLFKVGPFKKFKITIGKPMINNGAIQYENTYYRIVELKTKNNRTEQIWAKIETSWFKDTRIEYKPRLSNLKK